MVALLVALVARVPGIFWGQGFAGGFRAHHVDEGTHVVLAKQLINPRVPTTWKPDAYPTGLAVHVAIPFVLARAATGRLADEELPLVRAIVLAGRSVSVAYGVLTVWVLWLLARRLFPSSPAVPDVTAWLAALGGLHVSQSHFFVADVPVLFWSLLAAYLLLRDREDQGTERAWLAGAAFAVGAALGVKLAFHLLPALGLVALLGRGRIARCVSCAVFGLAGFALVTALTFTSLDVARALAGDTLAPPEELDVRDFPLLYGIELLPSVGTPVLALALAGLVLAFRAAARAPRRRVADVGVALVLPLAAYALVLPGLAPFPRHLLPFFPALFVLAAAAIVAIRGRELRRAVLLGTIAWSAALVMDTERLFLRDPRADALAWLETHVPAGKTACWPAYARELERCGLVPRAFPAEGEPDVVVAEAYRVNHWLSGTGLRDSRPQDHRRVFNGVSAAELAAWQGLFDGRTALREAARFPERYRMPEPRLADRLLGNRSRNYLGEIVIFARP